MRGCPYLGGSPYFDIIIISKVFGDEVNRGAGYGLEIPCIYHLYGPKPYIDKMKELVDAFTASGLV